MKRSVLVGKVKDSMWVSTDGTWGTDQLIIIDTSKWSVNDWRLFENVPDSKKFAIAVEIDKEKQGADK